MWWPRPRWKNDICTHFSLSLIVTITTSYIAMADEGQHCAGSDMSAVVWTTALCTMLLVLVVIAIYFVYCKKKEHDWSSLWWKNNSDKNLVLQTSAPMKGHQEKNGGTDNPAFLADTNTGDGFTVVSSGLTRIVRVPSSTIDTGSLGIELLTREECGRKVYMCKHNDGLKGRLTALRLVFDERPHRSGGPAVDLGRALVELSREYGLHVQLETEGESAAPSAADENDGGGGTATAKPNLLSVVREKAQRLWNHRQLVFKGRTDVVKKEDAQTLAGADIESGGPAVDGLGTAEPVHKSACSVSTVDETAAPVAAVQSARTGNRPVQYRTLEYGASAADAAVYASPDSGVQCCTVNSSEPPAAPVVIVQEAATAVASASLQTAAAAAADTSDAAIDGDRKPDKPRMDELIDGADKPMNGADEPMNGVDKPRTDEPINATGKPRVGQPGTDDGADKPRIGKPGNDDDPKRATSNPPPPPPPRKYSAPVISGTNYDPAATTGTTAVVITAYTETAVAPALPPFAVPDTVAPVTAVYSVPDKCSAAPGAQHEIRMNDDYYWCTTTAMAPSMSTFGKRANNTAVDGSGKNRNENAIAGFDANVAGTDGVLVAVRNNDTDDTGVDSTDAVVGGTNSSIEDAVVGGTNSSIEDAVIGGTTSIEDASLPSFSSDDDDDDDDDVGENDDVGCNGVQYAAEKDKSTARSVDDDVARPSDGRDDKVGENNSNGRRKNDSNKTATKTAECNGAPPRNRTETDAPSVAAEPKSVTTKLPTLRLSLSSPLQTGVGCCTPSTSSSSASSTSSTSSSPTNNNNSPPPPPIVSKIPVRRQSAGSGGSTPTAVSSPITSNGTAKKSIPLPLSRSGSRLAMWTSAN